MSFLNTIAKRIFEANAGRISWRQNMWAIVGSKWDKVRLQNKNLIGSKILKINAHGEFVEDGRVLVRKTCTLCPCAPIDDLYFDGKWYWTPATECRRCRYHRAAGSGFRFPRCTFKRPTDKHVVAQNLIVQVSDLVQKAVDDAKRLIK